ncbi:hypothetical protein [Niastella populi]|uniref:Uncharacterized protein n=1 Tax=Niastella populi TaxID=550983 RepID=A0A1V9G6Y0_9BACT|nr:hypothetical protein [Niastella populi]OQP66226.1 hypothetical protein A4R26_14155 [Niastella populi]
MTLELAVYWFESGRMHLWKCGVIPNGYILVEINLQSGGISLNKTVTDFLQKLPKDTNYVSQIRVAEDGYYLTIFFDLYHITTSGVATKVHNMSRFLEDVYVLNDNLIVGNMDSVELIGKSGKLLYAWPISNRVSNGYIKGEKGLYHSANGEDSTLEFQSNGENRLSINRYPPLSELTKMKEPYLSYVSDKYFIVFPYGNRNVIYAIKKDMNKLDICKTIAVKGVNFTPTFSQMQNEEGYPNIKIGYWNNVYYIFSVIKGNLKILSFTV